MDTPQCSVISLTDIELTALIRCARRRLIVIVPGLSESAAKALVDKWRELGPQAVQVVLDPDPEICRLGLGEVAALELLQKTAVKLQRPLFQQQGLRVGLVVTDETATIYSPTPLLVEAGGKPGERQNAVRLEIPNPDSSETTFPSDPEKLNVSATRVCENDVARTRQDLETNPPVKFDLARKVRVFNALFEFVEFEARGIAIARKMVPIPPDLMVLANEPKAQKLLRSSFQLIGTDVDLSGQRINKLKQFIAKKYLIVLPGYGTVILRTNKSDFLVAIKAFERYVLRFQRMLKKRLAAAIEANRDLVVSALLPGVVANPPSRWKRFLGSAPPKHEVKQLLQSELEGAFGSVEDVFENMNVKVVFKGVTYESLSDPEFIKVAHKAIRSPSLLHEEFEAAVAGDRK